MGYAILSARKLLLNSKINSINFELMRISEERLNLQKYGASLADGYLDFKEMAGMPLGLRPFALQYAMTGQIGALMGAQADANMFMMQIQSNPQMQQYLNPYIMNSLFQKALKARLQEARKAEEARIHVIESELDQKQKRLETQLNAANKELESVEKAEDAAIGRATPKYA